MNRLFPRSRSATPTRKPPDSKKSNEASSDSDSETKDESHRSTMQRGKVPYSPKSTIRKQPARPSSAPPPVDRKGVTSGSKATPINDQSVASSPTSHGKPSPRGRSPNNWIMKQAGKVIGRGSSQSRDRESSASRTRSGSATSVFSSSPRFNRFQRSPKAKPRTPSSSPSKADISSVSTDENGSVTGQTGHHGNNTNRPTPVRRKSATRKLVDMMSQVTSPKAAPASGGAINPRPRPRGNGSRDFNSTHSSNTHTPLSPGAISQKGMSPRSSSSKPVIRNKGLLSQPQARSHSAKPPSSRKLPPPTRSKSREAHSRTSKSPSSHQAASSSRSKASRSDDSIDRKPSGSPPSTPPRTQRKQHKLTMVPGIQDEVEEIKLGIEIDRIASGNSDVMSPTMMSPNNTRRTHQKTTSSTESSVNYFNGSTIMSSPNGSSHVRERPMSPRLLAQMPLPSASNQCPPSPAGTIFDGSFKGWSFASRPEIRLGDLVAVDFLGEGHFGQVKCVAWRPKKGPETKGLFALKILERDRFENKVVASGRSEEYYIFNEREIMIEVDSSFHIKLINTYKSSKNLYILMEYAAGRNLKDQIERGKGLSDPSHSGALTRVKFYAANLVLAMEHLHRKQITHRDLKPGNILIDNQGYLKICDYGFSRWLPIGGKTRSIAGTYNYLTPEQCLDDEYDHSVDIWCLGITVYNMTYGVTPFEAPEGSKDWQKVTMHNIQFKQLNFIESKRDLPMPGKLFVKSILNRDPRQRFGADLDYKAIKSHAWFNGVDFDAIERRSLPAPWMPEPEPSPVAASEDI